MLEFYGNSLLCNSIRKKTNRHRQSRPCFVSKELLRRNSKIEIRKRRRQRQVFPALSRQGRCRAGRKWHGGLGRNDAIEHAVIQTVEREFQTIGDSQFVVDFAEIVLTTCSVVPLGEQSLYSSSLA